MPDLETLLNDKVTSLCAKVSVFNEFVRYLYPNGGLNLSPDATLGLHLFFRDMKLELLDIQNLMKEYRNQKKQE
jgi:hypothetical protein